MSDLIFINQQGEIQNEGILTTHELLKEFSVNITEHVFEMTVEVDSDSYNRMPVLAANATQAIELYTQYLDPQKTKSKIKKEESKIDKETETNTDN